MGRAIALGWVALLALAAAAAAEERLAVLEFFGRPAGAYCRAAAPAMIVLQGEMEGRAVLLEYDYDAYPNGRVDRWWAANTEPAAQVYLPLVMVGSGYRIATGPVNYEPTYRSMLEAELARPPSAALEAYSRRVGQVLRLYLRVENRSGAPLLPADDAAVWVVVWEDARIGLTDTWVRATAVRPLTAPLESGASTTMVVDIAPISGVDWSRARSLALLEHRPGGEARYDMLQAAVALPAAIQVSPGEVDLSEANPVAEVALSGPHVLVWTASSDVTWLEVTPATGALPARATLALRPGAVPPGSSTAVVSFAANGDELSSSATVLVTVEGTALPRPRRPRGRVLP